MSPFCIIRGKVPETMLLFGNLIPVAWKHA